MTIGSRIAQKRKELGLSQEALGEALGVSRQSIYKWESDTALPEIEKLVALSKRFDVSVGWLLGVEGDSSPTEETASAVKDDGELSETQLKMVEEIVARYLEARPKPKPRRRWPRVLAVIALLAVGMNLFNRLDQLSNQYNNLQYSVSNITSSVNSQINGISGRVEEILKAQNSLTADYGTKIDHMTRSNTILFSAYAVPKTYVEGMTAEFSVDNGTGGIQTVAGQLGFNQKFFAEPTCKLTDTINLSVTFVYPDGTRQTQLLDTYEDLYSGSLPSFRIRDFHLFAAEVPGGVLTLTDFYVTVSRPEMGKYLGGYDDYFDPPEVKEFQIGLFRNQKLLAWAEPCEQPSTFHGFEGEDFFKLPDMTIDHLTKDDKLYIAALVTDTYDRQFMVSDIPYVVEYETDRDHPYLTYPSDGRYDHDPENWEF